MFGNDRPGPGVDRDEPRKKGMARFFELLAGDIGSLIKLNLLLQLNLLPGQALLAFAVINGFPQGGWLVLYIALNLLGAVPVGPAFAAASRCVCSLLEYEQGYMLHEFRMVYKHSFKQTVALGIPAGLALNAYGYIFLATMRMAIHMDVALLVAVLLSMAVFFAVGALFFLLAAYLELGPLTLLKNCLIILATCLPRCMGCAIVYMAGYGLVLMLFPISLAYLVLLGYILPMSGAMLLLWPTVDRLFGIGESLAEQRGRAAEISPKSNIHI